MKKIALFGGSFNPPHLAHFEMAKYIYDVLGVDEVWFLFSKNWQKDPAQYADIKKRMEMGKILAQTYPDIPFVMSDIQDKLGTHITFDVLTKLKEKHPDHHFIWTMGADSLVNFHTWKNFDDILKNFPIAVLSRPSYTQNALSSPTALKYKFLKVMQPDMLIHQEKGWCLLDGSPQMDVSSTQIRAAIARGQKDFDSAFQNVADYIAEHGLYGYDVK